MNRFLRRQQSCVVNDHNLTGLYWHNSNTAKSLQTNVIEMEKNNQTVLSDVRTEGEPYSVQTEPNNGL